LDGKARREALTVAAMIKRFRDLNHGLDDRCHTILISAGAASDPRPRAGRRNTMSAEDDLKATELVLEVLSHKAVSKIKFTIDKFTVEPSLYTKVADAIGKKKVTVIVNPLPAGVAALYVPVLKLGPDITGYDVIVLPKPAFGSSLDEQFLGAAAVVHECTHAGFDLLKTKMNHMQNEALAYVAAASFIIELMLDLKGNRTNARSSSRSRRRHGTSQCFCTTAKPSRRKATTLFFSRSNLTRSTRPMPRSLPTMMVLGGSGRPPRRRPRSQPPAHHVEPESRRLKARGRKAPNEL
jgi:hypothetical protein